MFGSIDFRGAVLIALMALPFVGIGYVMGMLHMRHNYLALLNKQRIETARAIRYGRQDAEKQRHIGFAIGFREGTRYEN